VNTVEEFKDFVSKDEAQDSHDHVKEEVVLI